MRFFGRPALLALMAMAIITDGTSRRARADDLFEGAPPAPPGYKNHKAAQFAVLSGKVPQTDTDPEVPASVVFHDDIEYAKPDGSQLTLDLYVPKQSAAPPPVLLFVHGGAWRSGKKEDAAAYAIPLAELGYATASAQYRLAPDHTFPKAIHDVNAAIDWLRSHAAEYGFDGSRMALLGGSAGGHLVLLAAYAQDPRLGAPANPDAVLRRVQAVVNIYGVTDLTAPVARDDKRVSDFFGAPYSLAIDRHALASPILHMDPDDPPTLTIHGTIDELVPIEQADRLHAELDRLGIPNHYDRIEGWPHSMDLARPIYERSLYITKKFLARYLPIEP